MPHFTWKHWAIIAVILYVALSQYGDKTKTAKIPLVGSFL